MVLGDMTRAKGMKDWVRDLKRGGNRLFIRSQERGAGSWVSDLKEDLGEAWCCF